MFVHIGLLISHFVIIDSLRASTDLLLTRVGPCYDRHPQNTIGKISEFRVTTQAYSSKLSGVMNFSENIRNGWMIKATMEKCMDIRNTDTCDPFKSFYVVNNGCGDDETEQRIYGTFFNYSRPKMKCPVQAGRYEIQDYPFNSEDNYVTVFESKVSTSVFGYMFRLDGYSRDRKKVFCVETYLQLLYKRNHSWTTNTKEQLPTSGPQTTVEDEED